MNYIDLTNFFQKNYDDLKNQKGIKPTFDLALNSQPFIKEYLKQSIYKQIQEELLGNLIDLPEKLERKLQKDMSFLFQEEEIKQFHQKELRKLSTVYEENPYAKIFSVDRFYNEIFENTVLKKLCNIILNRIAASEAIFDSSNNINTEALELSLKPEITEIKLAFSILIRAHLIKERIKEPKNDTEVEIVAPKRDLTQNQVVLLLERLGITERLDDLNLTQQAKIISDITGFSKFNVRKTLVRLSESKTSLKPQEKKDLELVDQYFKGYGI